MLWLIEMFIFFYEKLFFCLIYGIYFYSNSFFFNKLWFFELWITLFFKLNVCNFVSYVLCIEKLFKKMVYIYLKS